MTKQRDKKMTESALFWDKVATKYAASPVADESSYEVKLRKTQELLKPDMNVLEFGCGTGSTAIVHAPFVNQYTAIDISSNMIEIARHKQYQNGVKNIHFETAIMEDYADQAEQYDAILGLSILHLLDNYAEIINQTYQMLKPGGYFITNTGCLDDHLAFMKYIIPVIKFFGKAPEVEFFSRADLDDAMLEAGFKIEHQWIPPKSKTTYFMICRKPA